MEIFSALLAFCAGNSLVTGEFPAGQVRGALMFSLISAWINSQVNNREADDLRRHCVHYYVTVMITHSNEGDYVFAPCVCVCVFVTMFVRTNKLWRTGATQTVFSRYIVGDA